MTFHILLAFHRYPFILIYSAFVSCVSVCIHYLELNSELTSFRGTGIFSHQENQAPTFDHDLTGQTVFIHLLEEGRLFLCQ